MCKCYTVVAGEREIAGWMDGERERERYDFSDIVPSEK